MIGWLLRVAVLILCAVLLWQAVDWAEAGRLLRQASPGWLAAALAMLTLQTALSAERWRITAAQLGARFGFRYALGEYYLAQVINQALPGGVLGDAGRAVRAREAGGLWAAGQAVIFERLAGQLGLLAWLALGLSLGAASPARPDWIVIAAALLLGCGAIALAVGFALSRRSDLAQRFLHAIFGRDVWRRQVAASLGTGLCNVAAFAYCAVAVGAPLSPATAIILIPIVLFAMVLPLSIGGWGLREGAAVALFPAFGATPDEGLAASVAFGLVLLLSVAPGFGVLWFGRQNASSRPMQRKICNRPQCPRK